MSTAAIAIGELSDHDRELLQRAAARADTTLSFQPNLANALSRLRNASCLLVASGSGTGNAEIIDHVRDDAALFTLPVIVLADSPLQETWLRAYAQGADDIVPRRDAGGITRRLMTVNRERSGDRPEAALGRAVVASKDDANRRRIGRTLRSVGFDIAYAASVSEALEEDSRPVFVVSTEQAPKDAGAKRDVAYVNGVPVLFLGERTAFAPVQHRITDASARILFFADEQAKARFKDRRTSERKLWAGMCSFREAGALEPSFGLTHNVSREGLYVRTLDPPRAGTLLWLELQAPGTEAPVHLRATSVWTRLPGAKMGVVPPGFGLKLELDRCPAQDLSAFMGAYDKLA
jgi:CheY-like chemotaxis protein